jgi:putative transposase
MKIVVQVKLLPDAGEAPALEATLQAVNDAANWVSAVAYERRVFREYALRKHTYGELKTRGLGAQAAQHVIKKTCTQDTDPVPAGRDGPGAPGRRMVPHRDLRRT